MSKQMGKMFTFVCFSDELEEVITRKLSAISAICFTVLEDSKNSLLNDTSQIGQREQSRNNNKLTGGTYVATKKGVRNKVIDHEEALTGIYKKDCVDMLIEEALDDHDFPKVRSILHMLGYGIPENEMNELEIPPEWDSVLDTDDLELNIEEEDYEQSLKPARIHHFIKLNDQKGSSNWEGSNETTRTLQLEFAIRKQATPLIRIILCAYGHNISFKDDGPSDQESLYGYPSDPLP